MINYELAIGIMDIMVICLFFLMLSFSWYYVASLFISAKKVKPVPHSNKKTKFAIIVPARNESKVIEHIILSLQRQTYDKNYFDPWFIVESEDDPTIGFVRKAGYKYFVRKDLEGKRRKGFAIQELYNYFKENDIAYDAYMIFDADNILSKNYIKIMNDLRQTGVQVGLGYRNYTNASLNSLTITSAIFFSYMMTFTARMRTNLFKKTTLCGTGYYIDAQVIDDAGGWIFTGMTEDIQLTTWCYYHDVNMRYYPLVDYYDEQCSTLKASHNQKVRWIWGYFHSKKQFKQPGVDYHNISPTRRRLSKFEFNVAIYPFAVFTVLNFLLFAISLGLTISSFFFSKPEYSYRFLGMAFFQFGVLYLTYIIVALAVIIKDNKKLKFNGVTILYACLTYILFFGGILIAVLDGLFRKKKRSDWTPIEHTGDITSKEANKSK